MLEHSAITENEVIEIGDERTKTHRRIGHVVVCRVSRVWAFSRLYVTS